jgi:hypothetical protein
VVHDEKGKITTMAYPTCVTPEQQEQARRECLQQSVPAGLGRALGMGPPFEGVDPCRVRDLPLCLSRPSLRSRQCLAQETVQQIQGCFVNPSAAVCPTIFTPTLMERPFCPSVTRPVLPDCIDDKLRAGISYCDTHGWNGPDKVSNALCWTAMHDPDFYGALKAKPSCTPPTPFEQKRGRLVVGGILAALLVGGGVVAYRVLKKRKG